MEQKAGATGQWNPPSQWEELTFPWGGGGEGSGRAWAPVLPPAKPDSACQPGHTPYALSSEVSCIPCPKEVLTKVYHSTLMLWQRPEGRSWVGW